mgnify:CR=1 FL=1
MSTIVSAWPGQRKAHSIPSIWSVTPPDVVTLIHYRYLPGEHGRPLLPELHLPAEQVVQLRPLHGDGAAQLPRLLELRQLGPDVECRQPGLLATLGLVLCVALHGRVEDTRHLDQLLHGIPVTLIQLLRVELDVGLVKNTFYVTMFGLM